MFGEKLMKLRKRQGLSQQEVADTLGVTRQTVSNWECDQGAPALYIWTKTKKLELKRLQENSEEEISAKRGKPSVYELLLPLKGRQCELMASVPLPILGFESKLRGTVVDVDSEWVMLSTETRKKETVRVLRISQFSDVHEITA